MLSQERGGLCCRRQLGVRELVGCSGVCEDPGSRMLYFDKELAIGQVLVIEQIQNGVDWEAGNTLFLSPASDFMLGIIAAPLAQQLPQRGRVFLSGIAGRIPVISCPRWIAVSDVVIENFAVGVIERLGLSYEVISAERPDIIMVSSSGTGHSGPHKDYVAYGSLLQHYTGWNSISGYPQREPVTGGLWADPWVGMELAMVTAAALNHRALTGQGHYIDFSMAEALSASIPEAILDYQMNHRVREPMGNRDEW